MSTPLPTIVAALPGEDEFIEHVVVPMHEIAILVNIDNGAALEAFVMRVIRELLETPDADILIVANGRREAKKTLQKILERLYATSDASMREKIIKHSIESAWFQFPDAAPAAGCDIRKIQCQPRHPHEYLRGCSARVLYIIEPHTAQR